MAPVPELRVARILVIKWSALGDMAMATAVFEDIARAYPQATIHLNTLPNLAGLFEHDPRFAEVWAVDVRARGQRLSQSLAWLRHARAGDYDMVIDLQRSDHTRMLLALWIATGRAPRIRAGNRGGFPYNRQPAIRRSGAHALATMRSVLESLGISWGRGANENMNGLIRQFFPKKMSFDSITPDEIRFAVDKLNHRPRKCLGFRTPHEVFMAQLQSQQNVVALQG